MKKLDLTQKHIEWLQKMLDALYNLATDKHQYGFSESLKESFKDEHSLVFEILQVVEGYVKLAEIHRQLHGEENASN